MDENKKNKKSNVRRNSSKSTKDKSFTLKSLPKIIFGGRSDGHQDDFEISGVIQGSVNKNVSFRVDDTGTLDLSTVPKEFQDVVQKLFEKVSEQKFLTGDEDKDQDCSSSSPPTVVRRKGPRVEKGMKDEEIIQDMQSLVTNGDPWEVYSVVGKVSLDHLLGLCTPRLHWIKMSIDYTYLKVP